MSQRCDRKTTVFERRMLYEVQVYPRFFSEGFQQKQRKRWLFAAKWHRHQCLCRFKRRKLCSGRLRSLSRISEQPVMGCFLL